MPIYEFECKKCLNRFELLILCKTEEKITCPECGSEEVNKLFSAFASKSESSNSNCGSTGFS
jgi:putative FmdB family regulatory protein